MQTGLNLDIAVDPWSFCFIGCGVSTDGSGDNIFLLLCNYTDHMNNVLLHEWIQHVFLNLHSPLLCDRICDRSIECLHELIFYDN